MSGTRLRRPILMMVTDRRRTAGRGPERDLLVTAAARAAHAGVDVIQIRERGLDDRSLLLLVERIRDAIAGTGAQVVVNDRIDVAEAGRAHGVHLPALGIDASRARQVLPEGRLVGRSVHSEAEARAVERDGGCDYLVFGSVFASASKSADHPVAGLDALARVCQGVRLPVLAIGGITAEHAPDIAQAGASGIAAIGLFASGDEAELARTVVTLKAAFDGY
jgi:thiamine-phosphate pyrophosphorylase